jgi:hypothetical protein
LRNCKVLVNLLVNKCNATALVPVCGAQGLMNEPGNWATFDWNP